MPRRDTTGLPESGWPLTTVPVAEIMIDEPEPGRGVATPMRPKGISATDYRARYDSIPHVVCEHGADGRVVGRTRVAGAVSAAVVAHGHGETPVTIAPLRPTCDSIRTVANEVAR